MSPGRVSFVGAGPGAADLLTLRAATRIAEADIVIWAASLVHEDVLQHARADAVVVNHAGTEAMAKEYGGRNVRVIPTSVDLARWRPRDSWKTDRFTLGWVGTPANLPNLKEIAPALRGHRLALGHRADPPGGEAPGPDAQRQVRARAGVLPGDQVR